MSEFRRDAVSGHWVIVAPERASRPTDFPVERRKPVGGFCPFCEGHEERTPPEIAAFRAEGSAADGPGWRVRALPNRFPALRSDVELVEDGDGLFRRMNGFGRHEVIVESPRHVLSMSEMSPADVGEVFRMYRLRMLALREEPGLAYGMIFKNVGAAAGATLEHSHSQLVAMPAVPRIVGGEIRGAERFFEAEGRCVFCALLEEEVRAGARMILEGEHFAALAPYAARFPFETWILPLRHCGRFEEMEPEALGDLAAVLWRIFTGLDIALDSPAYNYIIHTVPFASRAERAYHWHIEVIPRVTRIAGFEWGTGFHINPVAPEKAAETLRRALSR